ncbi:hypothetical protein D3C76_1768740 [compost metagenome]
MFSMMATSMFLLLSSCPMESRDITTTPSRNSSNGFVSPERAKTSMSTRSSMIAIGESDFPASNSRYSAWIS